MGRRKECTVSELQRIMDLRKEALKRYNAKALQYSWVGGGVTDEDLKEARLYLDHLNQQIKTLTLKMVDEGWVMEDWVPTYTSTIEGINRKEKFPFFSRETRKERE